MRVPVLLAIVCSVAAGCASTTMECKVSTKTECKVIKIEDGLKLQLSVSTSSCLYDIDLKNVSNENKSVFIETFRWWPERFPDGEISIQDASGVSITSDWNKKDEHPEYGEWYTAAIKSGKRWSPRPMTLLKPGETVSAKGLRMWRLADMDSIDSFREFMHDKRFRLQALVVRDDPNIYRVVLTETDWMSVGETGGQASR